jgi:hypothetical protein
MEMITLEKEGRTIQVPPHAATYLMNIGWVKS